MATRTRIGNTHPIVRQIVDRQHVGTSNRGVISAIYHGLSDKGRTAEYREVRKGYYKIALAIHKENRHMYRCVMSGQF